MRIRSAFVFSCAVGALALGCARRGTISDPFATANPDPIRLEITNNNWLDMVIYVVRGGQRIRLMTVVATNTATTVLDPELLGPGGEIRVLAYPIGSVPCLRCSRRDRPGYSSPRLFAQPGSTVSINLETDLRRSSAVTW